MEAALGPIIAALFKLGAPWIMVAVLLILYLRERKETKEWSQQVVGLSQSMVKATSEFNATLRSIGSDVEELRRRTR